MTDDSFFKNQLRETFGSPPAAPVNEYTLIRERIRARESSVWFYLKPALPAIALALAVLFLVSPKRSPSVTPKPSVTALFVYSSSHSPDSFLPGYP